MEEGLDVFLWFTLGRFKLLVKSGKKGCSHMAPVLVSLTINKVKSNSYQVYEATEWLQVMPTKG